MQRAATEQLKLRAEQDAEHAKLRESKEAPSSKGIYP